MHFAHNQESAAKTSKHLGDAEREDIERKRQSKKRTNQSDAQKVILAPPHIPKGEPGVIKGTMVPPLGAPVNTFWEIIPAPA